MVAQLVFSFCGGGVSLSDAGRLGGALAGALLADGAREDQQPRASAQSPHFRAPGHAALVEALSCKTMTPSASRGARPRSRRRAAHAAPEAEGEGESPRSPEALLGVGRSYAREGRRGLPRPAQGSEKLPCNPRGASSGLPRCPGKEGRRSIPWPRSPIQDPRRADPQDWGTFVRPPD